MAKDLYSLIKNLAKERDMTIRDVERAAELSNGSIVKWRDHTPNFTSLTKVAAALSVTISDLI